MIFINYRFTLVLLTPLFLILLGGWIYQLMRRKTNSGAWLAARVVAIGIMSLGGLLLLMVGCAAGFNKTINYAPVYSNDHRYAARVSDFDGGALGGNTEVTLFTDGGFRNKDVLYGGWKIVEAQDVHWISNSELLIEYPTDTGWDPPACSNFKDIKVICKPSGRKTWNH